MRLFMFIISNVGYLRRKYTESITMNSDGVFSRPLPYGACFGGHVVDNKAVWVIVDDIKIRIVG